MTTVDILNDIIRGLKGDEVPLEYVKLVQVLDRQGRPRQMGYQDFVKLVQNEEVDTSTAEIHFDTDKIRRKIVLALDDTYARLGLEWPDKEFD